MDSVSQDPRARELAREAFFSPSTMASEISILFCFLCQRAKSSYSRPRPTFETTRCQGNGIREFRHNRESKRSYKRSRDHPSSH